MKHHFIVNPHAGKEDVTTRLIGLIDQLDSSIERQVYITRCEGDATAYVHSVAIASPEERFRFYACGGDGTLNEVVSGVVGLANSEVACYPCGSGNDYVKYYGGSERFLSFDRLVHGEARAVDVMSVNDRYSINICNFGFDAHVCKTMMEVRRKPVIGGRNAYTTGIVKALVTGRRTCCRITVDGKVVHDGDMLLCTLGNGRYVGGAYQCSPLSQNDDGLIEVCLFKPLSIISFAKLLGSYRDGTFIHRADVQDKMVYLRGREVLIEAPEEIDLCVDGEMMCDSRFNVVQMQHAVQFVVPIN